MAFCQRKTSQVAVVAERKETSALRREDWDWRERQDVESRVERRVRRSGERSLQSVRVVESVVHRSKGQPQDQDTVRACG